MKQLLALCPHPGLCWRTETHSLGLLAEFGGTLKDGEREVWDGSAAALGDLRSSGCDEWTLGDCSHGRLGRRRRQQRPSRQITGF